MKINFKIDLNKNITEIMFLRTNVHNSQKIIIIGKCFYLLLSKRIFGDADDSSSENWNFTVISSIFTRRRYWICEKFLKNK